MNASRALAALLVAGSLALAGCATTGTAAGGGAASANPADPWEPMNRAIFGFNDTLDGVVLKPAARVYVAVIPEVVRNIVGNVFANIGDLWTSANQLLQGKPSLAVSDLSRFVINTTFGFAGFADVASSMGIDRDREDFGQTLGVWGLAQGPYLVLPFFGPSSVRDGSGFAVDWVTDPVRQIDSVGERNNAYAVRFVDQRAALFSAERVLEGAALDKYSFIRDGYLQRRRNQVYDGNPPPQPEDDSGADGEKGPAPASK